MKVLFVSSGNTKLGINPIIKNQGESLSRNGIKVEYFTIKGKRFLGYAKNIFTLKRFLHINHYDIIHSHFLLSSIVASFMFRKNLVVSLMGSDVYTSKLWNLIIKLFYKYRWNATIVKSKRMADVLGLKNLKIIPNGVDLNVLFPMNLSEARDKIHWRSGKKILFLSNPERPEKNYRLASEAVKFLNDPGVELIAICNVKHSDIKYYLNASDVLLLTSHYEGSPNIIKEAMACNCPIVATDVGDVGELISDTEGCYLTSFDSRDVAAKIKKAIDFGRRTNGRERIIELGLDSEIVANKIIEIYKDILNL